MTDLNYEFFDEKTFKHDKPVGPKGYKKPDGNEVWFYYANNKGRGSNNVTVLLVEPNNDRYNYRYVREAENKDIVIERTKISAWRGKLSRYITIF